jgi:hypothetical protein
MSELKINQQSIRTELKSFEDKPYKCLFEYIWNSFDAGATKVDLAFDVPKEGIGYVKDLVISDNGHGWDFSNQNAETFLSSSKASKNSSIKTLPKGKYGRGRYVFIWVAERIEILSQNKSITLNHSTKIENNTTNKKIKGTEIHFKGITERLSDSLFSEQVLFNELLFEFGWFIISNKNYEIRINNKKLEVKQNIKSETKLTKSDLPKKIKDKISSSIEVRIVLWKEKPSEYSKFYFLDKNQKEVFKHNTGFNKKKDEFWHSIYITSSLFEQVVNLDEKEDSQASLDLNIKQNKQLQRQLLLFIKQYLISLRKPYLIEQSNLLLDGLKDDGLLPELHEFGIYDDESYGDLIKTIYTISPSLFTGKGSAEKKFILATFAGLLSTQDDILIKTILEQLQELTEDEKADLLNILNRSSLSNIVKTIKEIDHRLNILDKLKTLISEHEKETLEVKHIQKILDENFWLFGEQFRLFSSTEGALKRVLVKYAKEILEIEDPMLDTEPNGEVDLFLVKTEAFGETKHKNIVVELKRASKKLTHDKDYQQIDNYRKKILEQSLCNGENQHWEFYLIGRDYDEGISDLIENSKSHGEKEKGLTLNIKNGRVKMYVRKWSDILEVEWGTKMKFLKEKLEIQAKEQKGSSPKQIVDDLLIDGSK